MFNFKKQAEFQAKLMQVYEQLNPATRFLVSQQYFVDAFPIIEINGRGAAPDKPGDDAAFQLTDGDFRLVVDAFQTVYSPS
jgi:hypothetical protein